MALSTHNSFWEHEKALKTYTSDREMEQRRNHRCPKKHRSCQVFLRI